MHLIRATRSLSRIFTVPLRCIQYGADLPDPLEHETGIAKKELLAKLAGDDRYEPKVFRHGEGSKDKPNLIPSHFDQRLIGCVCTESSMTINWMWLHRDHSQRCECGYWFKLVDADPESLDSYAKHVKIDY